MTPAELCDRLDQRFSIIIDEYSSEMTDKIEYNGTVSGFLIKTGVRIAAAHGCPRDLLVLSLQHIIDEIYR